MSLSYYAPELIPSALQMYIINTSVRESKQQESMIKFLYDVEDEYQAAEQDLLSSSSPNVAEYGTMDAPTGTFDSLYTTTDGETDPNWKTDAGEEDLSSSLPNSDLDSAGLDIRSWDSKRWSEKPLLEES